MIPPLLLDENLPVQLADSLRKRGCDAQHISELNLKSEADPVILAKAIELNRIIVTYDVRDFIRLDEELRNDGKEHPGILITPERPIGELLRRIEQFDWEQIRSTVRHL